MGENTENHSFYKPADDETGWGSKVGSNFDSLDTDTLIKDTFANRPADPPSDTWFLATDRRIFYRYDGTSWDAIAGAGTAANPLPEQHVTATTTEDAEVGRGVIDKNESATGVLSTSYAGAAVDSSGTYYVLDISSDPISILKTTTPRDKDSYTQVNTLPRGLNSRTYDIHVTQNDTLLVGTGGAIYRSTDGGDTFTSVSTTITNNIWSWTENSSGSILAAPRGETRILESTDDGQTWSNFATSTDFPNFSNHVHKVAYHPANDYVIVTGGDSDGVFYRSTDGGASWDELTALDGQYVAITCHPTDGTIYYLGHDYTPSAQNPDAGIVRVTDNGTSSVTQEFVQNLNLEFTRTEARGTFSLQTVYDSAAGTGYYLASSLNQAQELVWASQSLEGKVWRTIGQISDFGTGVTTTASDAYELIDPTAHDTAVMADAYINIEDASNPAYGAAHATPIDKGRVRDNIQMQDNGLRHRDVFTRTDTVTPVSVAPSDGDAIQIQAAFDNWQFVNGTAGTEILELQMDNLIVRFPDASQIQFENAILREPKVYNNAAASDLLNEELAIDENLGGAGTFAFLYKDSSGTLHTWSED